MGSGVLVCVDVIVCDDMLFQESCVFRKGSDGVKVEMKRNLRDSRNLVP